MALVLFLKVLLALASPQLVKAAAPAELNIHFTYSTTEGDTQLSCTQQKMTDLPDYRVHCGDAGSKKDYSVHFVIHQYSREQSPKTMFEVLYWVTEATNQTGVPSFHSSTLWLRLKEATDLDGMTFFQSIENDSASLQLRLQL